MDFDKKKMTCIKTAKTGKINRETVFDFHQSGRIVTARYAGGKIAEGFLVGKMNGDTLEFRYAQMDTEDNLDGGFSSCDVEELENGKIRLIERFRWESMDGSGENIIEEL